VNHREAYGMFAVNGILFNHESPRRGPTFVTRKITRSVVRIRAGVEKCLFVGNLDAKRDWGHARDYVECMWRMLQHENPEDFVVATGECHSVREFVELAFDRVGLTIAWKGVRGSEDEVGVVANDANEPPDANLLDRVVVRVDPVYFRPAEVDLLCGNAEKAEREPEVWLRRSSHGAVEPGIPRYLTPSLAVLSPRDVDRNTLWWWGFNSTLYFSSRVSKGSDAPGSGEVAHGARAPAAPQHGLQFQGAQDLAGARALGQMSGVEKGCRGDSPRSICGAQADSCLAETAASPCVPRA
jgi:hypothetical protein